MESIFQRIIERPLSVLFPVRLPQVELEFHPAPESWDAFEQPVTECGILWRAYDVRRTGIERMQQEGL